MLPSLYASGDAARAWSLARAAAYGAGIGALAALVKIFGLRQGGATAAPFWDVAEARGCVRAALRRRCRLAQFPRTAGDLAASQ